MEDDQIVDLYWARSERAVAETAHKYGRYCYSIAYNILLNAEDADESVNDTYMDAWNAMPPHRPSILSTFLGKITRQLSIDKWRIKTAEKRGGGEITLALEELEDCVASNQSVEQIIELRELTQAINRFLQTLPDVERDVFVSRYWFLVSVKEIADSFTIGESKTKTRLFRTRKKLQNFLRKEGYQ